jgi:hypothetical protein
VALALALALIRALALTLGPSGALPMGPELRLPGESERNEMPSPPAQQHPPPGKRREKRHPGFEWLTIGRYSTVETPEWGLCQPACLERQVLELIPARRVVRPD